MIGSNTQYGMKGKRIAATVTLSLMALSANAEQASLPPVSVFSSYVTEAITLECQQAHITCVEDFVSPEDFFSAINAPQRFVNAAASEDGFDYEILVANMLLSDNRDTQSQRQSALVSEFDVTWRGIPLGSYQMRYTINDDVNTIDKPQIASVFVQEFFQHSDHEQVFSANTLFEKLQASNYPQDLKLPDAIDVFELYDMQLYHDPLQGAVARYSHPEFPRDVLDVFVYPVFDANQTLSSNAEQQLSSELQKEFDDIELIVASREIDDVKISDIQALDWQVDKRQYHGLYFDVMASDEDGEPMFTTTYLFQSKDKFIKFSANFPGRIANQMVKDALPHIEVPDPSPLMQNLRGDDTVSDSKS